MHDVKIIDKTPVNDWQMLAEAEVNGQRVEFKYDRKLVELARDPEKFLRWSAYKAATGKEPEWGTV